ncbi:MAG: hypothetical protein HC853_12010, partial [Anaerolineae bacterium]|nr:hypothetical protein [Anaerolineae bacterium]
MMLERIVLCAALSLAANVMAEAILCGDLHRPWRVLSRQGRWLRVLRWVACTAGIVALGASAASVAQVAFVALFTVSAATDFETKFLPSDGFVLGCTTINVLGGFVLGGASGLRDVVVAQAICFVVTTFAVALFGLCDSGDIKLAMQFGAACGNLAAVTVAVFVSWLVVWVVIVGAFVIGLVQRRSWRASLRSALRIQLPQGPLLWCGLLWGCVGWFWGFHTMNTRLGLALTLAT